MRDITLQDAAQQAYPKRHIKRSNAWIEKIPFDFHQQTPTYRGASLFVGCL
jgi:hypothetical protein